MILPNFIIIGEVKAGTTSLYQYLKQHPDVFMPALKEPRFFAYDSTSSEHQKMVPNVFPITTIEEYANLFKEAQHEKAIGEASPNYFNSPIAPARIHEIVPNVKLIVSLRNPVDRIYSLYLMHVRAGSEKRTFIDAFRQGQQEWWIQTSFAHENLEKFYDFFDRSQVKVIFFDELIHEPIVTTTDIFNFIEVDSSFEPDTSAVHNQGGTPRFKHINSFLSLVRKNRRFMDSTRAALPQPLIRVLKRIQNTNIEKAPPLDASYRKEILEFYRQDLQRLQDLLKRDLSFWLQ